MLETIGKNGVLWTRYIISLPSAYTYKNVRRDKEAALLQDTRICSHYMKLANEVILLFCFLSEHAVEPFLVLVLSICANTKVPEMVDRIAQMLNYFMFHLAGPKSLNLKVRQSLLEANTYQLQVNNPQRFHFDPKWLLGKIVEIYLHFAKRQEFAQAVVSDIRSFKLDVFRKVVNILKQHMLIDEVKRLYLSSE